MANVSNIARSKSTEGASPMSQLLERFAVTRPWLLALSQAAAMLGLNVALRAAVA